MQVLSMVTMVTMVTGQEAGQSSTWRELRAVHAVLDSICHKLQNHRVRRFTDNQNVVRIVLYGSRKAVLQEEALAIFATNSFYLY